MERDQASTQRRDRNLGTRPGPKLLHAAGDVCLHGAKGKVQLVPYLLVAETFRDEVDDLELSGAQAPFAYFRRFGLAFHGPHATQRLR